MVTMVTMVKASFLSLLLFAGGVATEEGTYSAETTVLSYDI